MGILRRVGGSVVACALVLTAPSAVLAQALGTFQWTLQPFCNVVTATVTATETGYTLDGWDDQCGAPTKAPLVGQVSANPDGSLGLGFHVVTTPDAKAVSVIAIVNPATRAGTWRDSVGHSGTFAVGAIAGGSARPAPPALVGATGIDPSEVQRRVTGVCPAGQFLEAVNQDGSAMCSTPAGGGDITEVMAGPGLTGGSSQGNATLGVDFTTVARRDHAHAAPVGSESTGIGAEVMLQSVTNNRNVAVGAYAMTGVAEAAANVAIGVGALAYGSGTVGRNVAVGETALMVAPAASDNTAVGTQSMVFTDQATANTALGFLALNIVYGGSRNVAVGASALSALVGGGSQNTAMGADAGSNLTHGSRNIYLGNRGNNEDDTMRLGGTQTRAFIAGIRAATTGANDAIPVVIDSNGQLGTVSSSARTKHDIEDLPAEVSTRLQQLRPVQFRYNQTFANGEQPLQYGLIAEEVEQVLPELVAMGKDGTPETVKYHVLPSLLLAEVQRLSREVAELRALLAAERTKQ